MVTLVNFADQVFRNKQKWNSFSGKLCGIDQVMEYSPSQLDLEFVQKNGEIFENSKGYGNYIWKPFIISKALSKIRDGEYLFYADSGSFFLKNIKPLVNYLEKSGKSVMCFHLPLIEKQWTKKETFMLMSADFDEIVNSAQVMGGFILLKKNSNSVAFIEKYLNYCLNKNILCDHSNVRHYQNYPEFIAHRHDQSVLSILCKMDTKNVCIVGDLSDYGWFPNRYLNNGKYLSNKALLNPKNYIFKGTVLCVRKEKILIYFMKYAIRRILYLFGISK